MILEVSLEEGFNWGDVEPEYVSPVKWNEIIDELDGDENLSLSRWCHVFFRYSKIFNSWSVRDERTRKEIRMNRLVSIEKEVDEEGNEHRYCVAEFHRYIWMKDKVISSDKEEQTDKYTGMKAYLAIQKKFNGFNKTHTLSLRSVLSGEKYRKEYTLIKQCVPVQIQYMNDEYYGKIVEGVYKADVSSAFPHQIRGSLPTLHGCITVGGKAEPTEEYPFAFYTKSRHIKTYDGYDSKELGSRFFRDYYNCDDTIDDEEEVTILCKKMSDKYHNALVKAFEDCYDHRKDDAFNKIIMNATIGFFQLNSNPKLSFISAIVILRCNIDMIRRCRQLEKEGNEILFIATDSIAWKGKESPVAIDEKYLGSFTYEGKDIKFLGYSSKAYQWLGNDGKCTTKYAGVKKEESAKLGFGELKYKDTGRRYYAWDKDKMKYSEAIVLLEGDCAK